MKVRAGLLLITALLATRVAEASQYRWAPDASGDWNVPANWELVTGPAGAGYPNLPGDEALFDKPLTASPTITIPTGVTISIGRLAVASTTIAPVEIERAGTGLLVLDNNGVDARVDTGLTDARLVLNTPIELVDHLGIDGVAEFASIAEAVAGRNVTIERGSIKFVAENTYTGTTTVLDGVLEGRPLDSGLLFSAVVLIRGNLVVGDGVGSAASASVSITAGGFHPANDVQVRADGVLALTALNAFFPMSFGMDELTIVDGQVVVVPASGVLSLRDLNMTGGELRLDHPTVTLHLAGSLAATSTLATAARIVSPSFPNGSSAHLRLTTGNHDFTIADGPKDIDFQVDTARVEGNGVPDTGSLIKSGPGLMRIDSTTYQDGTLVLGGMLQVLGDASASAVTVGATATLAGTGTVGAVTVESGGTLAPGLYTGVLRTGSIALEADARVRAATAHPSSPPQQPTYSSLVVTGTVDLGGATLDLTATDALPLDTVIPLIDNDGTDPVVGTFAGLPEGATILGQPLEVYEYVISYRGGDGNDVVLMNRRLRTYYLTEGAVGSFFDEDIVLANPNDVDVPVTMRFMFDGGYGPSVERVVPARRRLTVNPEQIPGLEIVPASVDILTRVPRALAVERTMFWDGTRYGGHTATAYEEAAPLDPTPGGEREWFFAEGAQGFFDTYLSLATPEAASAMVDATVTFLRENEPPVVVPLQIPARQRLTIHAGNYPELLGRAFGMHVQAESPVTAERSMYFASTPTRLWSGGTVNGGNPAAATEWFHAEGASGTFFTTFILISNPSAATPANVTLRFLRQDGAPVELTKQVPAQGRVTVNPAAEGIAQLQNAAFSTVVTSDIPVVSERAMYWPTDVPLGEGHASSGLLQPSLNWALAEGRVGGANEFTTYILLANPNDDEAAVSVSYLRENAEPVVKTYNVLGNTRFNIDVGSMVPELRNESFGASITVTNKVPIAVERSMYWNVNGVLWQGGSNAVGTVMPPLQ